MNRMDRASMADSSRDSRNSSGRLLRHRTRASAITAALTRKIPLNSTPQPAVRTSQEGAQFSSSPVTVKGSFHSTAAISRLVLVREKREATNRPRLPMD
jgi:hypothetical protein